MSLVSNGLNEQTAAAVSHLLTSRDQYAGVEGLLDDRALPMYRCLRSQLQSHGIPHVGVESPRASWRGLARAGFEPVYSLPEFLKIPAEDNVAGGLVIISDAGTIGTSEMHALVELISAQGGRGWLIGNPNHLGPDGGDGMRILKRGGLSLVSVSWWT